MNYFRTASHAHLSLTPSHPLLPTETAFPLPLYVLPPPRPPGVCPSVRGYSATPDAVPDVDHVDVCFKGPNSIQAIAATCIEDPTCMGFTVTLPANAPDGSDIRICFLSDPSGATIEPSIDTVCLYSFVG